MVTLPSFNRPFGRADVDAVVRAKRTAGAADVYIIDIREAYERRNKGHIDLSINIPAGELSRALALRNAAFQQTYGVSKPRKNDRIVLYANNDMRIGAALEFVASRGYKQVTYLSGGYDEYMTAQRSTAHNDDL